MTGTTPLKVLIVDDEPLARERVRGLLAGRPGIEVVGEAADGAEAVAAIVALQPTLVFLDIQMPGATGLDVIREVGADRMPAVIFVTAYDQYAVNAFDVHAVDYLLKPFDVERFDAALRRVRRHIDVSEDGHDGHAALEAKLRELMQALPGAAPASDRLVVKSGGRLCFLRTDEIDWVEAAGNYVKLHVGREAHLMRETMQSIAARLDPRRFARIHRSRIVNIDRVKELHPWFNGDQAVILHDGTRLMMSRTYRDRFEPLRR